MKIILAGAGAFGQKHLDAIKQIPDIEVMSLVGRDRAPTQATAQKYGIPHATTDLTDALAQPGVTAAILCTPTQIHASQAIQCMAAGKHVQVEIPLADSWKDAQAVDQCRAKRDSSAWSATHDASILRISGYTAASRPANRIQQMDVQTYFLPSHEHERARAAALMDRSSAVAPRCAYRRSLPIPDGRRDRRRERDRRTEACRARHRNGHVDPAEGAVGRDLHVVVVVQQRGAARHVLPLHLRQRHVHRAL